MSAVALANRQKGEVLVALEVSSLDKLSYHSFHDITLEADDSISQIGHVIISSFGIFVVETQNHSGLIYGDESQPEWTCELGKIKHKFQNPLRQSYWHINALSKLLELPENLFYSIIAFCGEAEFRTHMPANVMTSGYSSYIRGKSARLIYEPDVQQLAEKFKSLMLSEGQETNHIRIDSLHQKQGHSNVVHNVHKLPPAAKTARSKMYALLQTLKEHFQKQSKKRIILLGSTAAAVLVAAFILFSYGNESDDPAATTQTESTRPDVQSSLSTDSIEPPSLAQGVSTEPVLAKKSEKLQKEEAWQRWYKEAEKCKRITDSNRVECANLYIAAKRRFEYLYAAGKLN